MRASKLAGRDAGAPSFFGLRVSDFGLLSAFGFRVSALTPLALVLLLATPCLAATKTAARPAASAWREYKETGSFITALCYDAQGKVWVGTEGNGIFRYDQTALPEKQWIRFTTTNGLGDDYAYSLACDKLGRIWAGHLNHGVSVFNGAGWTNYDILQGPIGERVFKIAICPTDGDVWMATSAGLTRYSERSADIPVRINALSAGQLENPVAGAGTSVPAADRNVRAPLLSSHWRYYTRHDGLPSDQVSALAFNTNGDLWLGTQCDGFVLAKANENYANWQTFPLLDELRGSYAGLGIPTKQINDILVTYDSRIFVATTCGLVFSQDYGQTWTYKRGPEAMDKFRAMTNLPPRNALARKAPPEIMSEDYVTCLAEDDIGLVWIGFRQQGFLAVDPNGWHQIFSGAPRQLNGADFIRCILPARDSSVFLGRYGGSLMQSRPVFGRNTLVSLSHSPIVGDEVTSPSIPSTVNDPGLVTSSPTIADTNSSSSSSSSSISNSPNPSLADFSIPLLPDAPGRSALSLLARNGPIPLAPEDDVSRGKDVSMDFALPDLGTTTNDMPAVAFADFPGPAGPPTLKELQAMLDELKAVPAADASQPVVVPIEDDWRTEGQWLGRHGRFFSVLCADDSPTDYIWGAGWDVKYDACIGPNHDRGDSIRYWVQWLKTADNRCLEMAPTYLHSRVLRKETTWKEDRRESEWDDHGEAYPMTMSGPHLYCTLSIPQGLFYLSLYDVNYNGHAYLERFRDYTISIRQDPGKIPLLTNATGRVIPGWKPQFAQFESEPELAGVRIADFWGGVYKRFLVRGPTNLTVRVNRNYSFNTILAGVMLDLVDELPPPYYETRYSWQVRQNRTAVLLTHPELVEALSQRRPPSVDPASEHPPDDQPAPLVLHALTSVRQRNPVWWAMNKQRFFLPLTRSYLAQLEAESVLQYPAANPRPMAAPPNSATPANPLPAVLPLPAGEGRGEGNSGVLSTINSQPSTNRTRLSAPLARCYYNLRLFADWEGKLHELDLLTAREIEKSVRWDTQTYSMSGKGSKAVTDYLAARTAGKLPTDQELEARFAAAQREAAAKAATAKAATKGAAKANQPAAGQKSQPQKK